FCAYIWEALADLGEHDLAKKALQHGIDLQNSDGSVPAYSDKKWICLTGVAQMALVGYKIGATDFSNKCMNYLGSIQNNTGGFLGSVGRGANYFPTEEPSWAVKYYLDAFSEKQRSIFNMSAETFPREIKEDDNRVTTVINGLGNINDKIVLDAGCGQGRYLKILANKFPNADLHGVDISDVMLKNNPASITTSIGSLLEINYPDNTFDCVYSVEALEHSLRPEAAIGELTRILKLNGKLIIIDKSTEKIGKIKLNTWEQWFDPKTLAEKMEEYGIKTTYKPIAYDKCETPDGWFYVWEGTKQ
ncbi:MAG: malonyl-CoA O-methyltransferase, partial [Lysobacterales bacterium]